MLNMRIVQTYSDYASFITVLGLSPQFDVR